MSDDNDDEDPETTEDEDILEEARERYDDCQAAWSEQRISALEDVRFARLGEQWPEEVRRTRIEEQRPCLTINLMPSFIRQVTNDARQNRPSIKVTPANEQASSHVADIFDGLIRSIERASDADVAYDTAVESAVQSGMGFFRIDVDYACDDAFDMDIKINRILNPFTVNFDPRTEAADSSDWRFAFISEDRPMSDFKREYPEADTASFGTDDKMLGWFTEDSVRVAEYWTRDEVQRKVLLMSNGEVIDADQYEGDAEIKAAFDAQNITISKERTVKSYEITHRLITGNDILKTTKWAGTMIPIVPVYGDEFNVEGRRYFRSLIYDAKDSQRLFNFWRTATAELVALAPKAPFIGPEEAFQGEDAERWGNANLKSYPYLSYKGQMPPQRQQFSAIPEGAMNEAMSAADDMKKIIGIHDAGLGVPGNEISGKAIRYRQHESDTSTFHFVDNLNRAIRCAGRIVVDLIPKVYSGKRIIRVLGQDGKAMNVPINQPVMNNGQPLMQPGTTDPLVFDLTVGKYDIAVQAGPSYTTRREEAAEMMTAFAQAAPQAAPLMLDLIARNSDWPEHEKLAERLQTLLPPAVQARESGQPPPPPQDPPEVQAAKAKAQADATAAQAKLQLDTQRAQAELQLKQQNAQAEQAMAFQQMQKEQELEIAKMERQHALKMAEIQQTTALRTEELKAETDLKLLEIGTKVHINSQLKQPN